MSNHVKGSWFISVFQMYHMSNQELVKIVRSENYRETTRRNARNELNRRCNPYQADSYDHSN